MKAVVSIFIFLALFGCITTEQPRAKQVITKQTENGTSEIVTEIFLPKFAKDFSLLSIDSDGSFVAEISPAQDEAGIKKALGFIKNIRVLYVLGSIGVILGGLLVAFKRTSTKGGIFVILSSLLCIAAGIIAPSIDKIATPAIIIVLIAGAAYFVFAKFYRFDL